MRAAREHKMIPRDSSSVENRFSHAFSSNIILDLSRSNPFLAFPKDDDFFDVSSLVYSEEDSRDSS